MGNFKILGSPESGFYVDGDTKGMCRVETSGGSLVVVTRNNDTSQSFW
jgi:hypothetical protein